MPSALTHPVAAAAIGAAFPRSRLPRLALPLAMALSLLPDVDVVGFWLGIRYGDPLGHRGFTHSLAFAAVLTAAIVAVLVRLRAAGPDPRVLWLYLFLAVSSHGALDAMTDGGLGVAFLSPFSTTRYVSPARPIHVSSLRARAFFSTRGVRILQNEILVVWLPCAAFAACAIAARRLARESAR